jgi:hypothetical protein
MLCCHPNTIVNPLKHSSTNTPSECKLITTLLNQNS